jgi:hypothetical protein
MKEIFISDKRFEMPENWTEIKQFLMPVLIDLVFLKPQNGSTKHEILRLCLGMTKDDWGRFNHQYFGAYLPESKREANAAILYELFMLIQWLWSEPITKQPFATIETENDTLYLPPEDFETMTWGELQDSLVFYEAYVKQLEAGDKYLDLLISSICRKKRPPKEINAIGWDGDIRLPYNEFHAKRNATLIADISYQQKLSILLFYAGTTKEILGRYEVFKTANEDDENQEEYPGQGFEKNTHLLAQKGIFGNYDQTRHKNCHNVLIFLEENKKDMEAEKEAYEAANSNI